MPDLVAQGPQPQDRWRRKLPPNTTLILGRSAGAWSTPWDDRVSRQHLELQLRGDTLAVRILDSALNPVFYRGRKCDDFQLRPGEHFVVGGTTFTLANEPVHVSLEVPLPEEERTFTFEELRRRPFRRADERIGVLSRLPEIISGSGSDSEMFVRLVNLLLAAVPRASAAAIVAAGPEAAGAGQPQVLHWDRRALTGTEFRPSERLIRRAIQQRQSVVHVWNAAPARGGEFTLGEGIDWAFCVPLESDACRGWALYVTGGSDESGGGGVAVAEDLQDDVKFTELTAATLGALRQVRLLTRRQASLDQFFSPAVLAALEGRDADEALAPREADVAVLFCDLRGFSRHSERHAENLPDLLARVSEALGVMTRHILEKGGVIGDFHGDSAMGFWGWPLAQPDAAERACLAALAIRRDFAAAADSETPTSLAGFRVGIGIASGRAVAGKIGTTDQVKVTVFGPVANLASRLEGLTKVLRVPILLDGATAEAVRLQTPADLMRIRRLARIKPPGMETPVEVSELLPPATELPELSDQHLAAFESAVTALQQGNWAEALARLHHVPPDDLAKDFLTVFIAQHNRIPPPEWDGVVSIR